MVLAKTSTKTNNMEEQKTLTVKLQVSVDTLCKRLGVFRVVCSFVCGPVFQLPGLCSSCARESNSVRAPPERHCWVFRLCFVLLARAMASAPLCGRCALPCSCTVWRTGHKRLGGELCSVFGDFDHPPSRRASFEARSAARPLQRLLRFPSFRLASTSCLVLLRPTARSSSRTRRAIS